MREEFRFFPQKILLTFYDRKQFQLSAYFLFVMRSTISDSLKNPPLRGQNLSLHEPIDFYILLFRPRVSSAVLPIQMCDLLWGMHK